MFHRTPPRPLPPIVGNTVGFNYQIFRTFTYENAAGLAIDEKISSGKFIEGEDYAPVQERGPKPENPNPKG